MDRPNYLAPYFALFALVASNLFSMNWRKERFVVVVAPPSCSCPPSLKPMIPSSIGREAGSLQPEVRTVWSGCGACFDPQIVVLASAAWEGGTGVSYLLMAYLCAQLGKNIDLR